MRRACSSLLAAVGHDPQPTKQKRRRDRNESPIIFLPLSVFSISSLSQPLLVATRPLTTRCRDRRLPPHLDQPPFFLIAIHQRQTRSLLFASSSNSVWHSYHFFFIIPPLTSRLIPPPDTRHFRAFDTISTSTIHPTLAIAFRCRLYSSATFSPQITTRNVPVRVACVEP